MTPEEFQNTVIQPSFTKPVLVDFWADWCDPCKILEPILDELAIENSDIWSLVKIDTDASREVAAQFDIMGCLPSGYSATANSSPNTTVSCGRRRWGNGLKAN